MQNSLKAPKSIIITGASSGIGEALARQYAIEGRSLLLTGRNNERLEAVAKICREQGAHVETSLTRVDNREAMESLIKAWHERFPLDLIIANAGVSGSESPEETMAETAVRIFDTNVHGVFNTVHPALEVMEKQGRGQVAIVASVAGYRGFTSAPSYSASKAAVKAYAEGLRGRFAPRNIRISVINPGFVKSRITDRNDFPMPFLMPAEKAAQIIAKGLSRDKGNITFPWQMKCIAMGLSIAPQVLMDWLARRAPTKE